MIRAVLEGVIFNLYTVLLALEGLIGEPTKIQATGRIWTFRTLASNDGRYFNKKYPCRKVLKVHV